jgi:hypothetical protein
MEPRYVDRKSPFRPPGSASEPVPRDSLRDRCLRCRVRSHRWSSRGTPIWDRSESSARGATWCGSRTFSAVKGRWPRTTSRDGPNVGGKRMQCLPCREGSSPELCQTRAPCGIERRSACRCAAQERPPDALDGLGVPISRGGRSMSNAITAMQGLTTDEAPTKDLTLNALR